MSAATPNDGIRSYNGIPEYDLPFRGMEPGASAGTEDDREVAVWATEDYGTQWTLDTTPLPDGAEDAESEPPAADGPQGAEELPCGHAAIYAESGTCMVCEPAFGTAADGEAYREQNPDIYGRDPLA